MQARLLLVGTNDLLREALREQFELKGEFVVSEAKDAEAARCAVETDAPDAVVFDPDGFEPDEKEALHLLKTLESDRPVIVLSCGETECGGRFRTEAGATVAKPFRFEALLVRVRAEIRKRDNRGRRVAIGPYVLDSADRLLLHPGSNGVPIQLTEKETAILEFLYAMGDGATSKAELLGRVWGYNSEVATHTLETHIYRLRRKMERKPSDPRILLTERGGYRLNC